jgi:hypothetical protein
MDEQRKRAILDEARANLECLAGIEQRAAIEPEPEPWYMRAPATIRSRRAASAGSTRLRRRTGTPSISASPRRSPQQAKRVAALEERIALLDEC